MNGRLVETEVGGAMLRLHNVLYLSYLVFDFHPAHAASISLYLSI